VNLLPFVLPRITIQPSNGAEYELNIKVLTHIIGSIVEEDRTGELNQTDEAVVIDLVKSVVTSSHFKRWTTGQTYKERDLLAIIERVFLAKSMSGLAAILAQKLPATAAVASDVRTRMVRRNGEVVPWNPAKIEISIRKALNAVDLEVDYKGFAGAVANEVTARVRSGDAPYIDINEVHDLVERVMIDIYMDEKKDAGMYRTFRAYMLYRSERESVRNGSSGPVASPAAPAEELVGIGQIESISVVEADGSSSLWDGEDLRARIRFALTGLDLNMTSPEIEAALRASFGDGMKRMDIPVTVNLNAKTLIERDADFAQFAGRIQMTYIYEEVLGWDILRDGPAKLKEMHRRYFADYIAHGISIKRLSPELANKYDLARMADALKPAYDLDFDFLGIQTLYDRYLIVDKTEGQKRRIETPQIFWLRVAMGIFIKHEKPEAYALEFYSALASRRFCSSTPTLFNAGSNHPQLSSCYLYVIQDDLDSIFTRGVAENAQLSKWAGGLGGSWTNVRGTGAFINGTNGESQGVIPFLKLHNDQLVAVNQGGRRRGSGCAYLESWHNDIFEFLELRKNVGDDRRRTHDMNTANWIPDLFMKRMEARGKWTLFRANQVPGLHDTYGKKFEELYVSYETMAEEGKIFGQQIEALDLWKKMLSMIFETGHPWITFKDPCNLRSPQDHVGVVHSSNLCVEITLNTSHDETAVCNLGSVVISAHLKEDGSIDHAKLRETVRAGVRALDAVIDVNFYPTEAARNANTRHRPVGMGVMGLADALYMKGVSFASEAAVQFSDEIMEAIAYYAYDASSDLAAELGTYSSYKGSKWDRGVFPQDCLDIIEENRGVKIDVPRGGKMDWTPVREKVARQGMRNSNVLAIAPTATISNIVGASPCIEPTYKNLFVKSNLSGEFVVLNQYMVRDLKKRGLWTEEIREEVKSNDGDLGPIAAIPADIKDRYLTAFDIDYKWIVEAAAVRQKWISMSQSLNFWIKSPDLKLLSHLYRSCWAHGLSTTYYLRGQGASSIEKATVNVKKAVRGVVGEDLNGGHPNGAHDLAAVNGSAPKTYSAEEKNACSIEAFKRGEECTACQ
jgi:ribonucleoside-diphosphate reductase alpha chain